MDDNWNTREYFEVLIDSLGGMYEIYPQIFTKRCAHNWSIEFPSHYDCHREDEHRATFDITTNVRMQFRLDDWMRENGKEEPYGWEEL